MIDHIIEIGIGILLIFIGPYIYMDYRKKMKQDKFQPYYGKYIVYGIAAFIIGVILIFKGLIHLSQR